LQLVRAQRLPAPQAARRTAPSGGPAPRYGPPMVRFEPTAPGRFWRPAKARGRQEMASPPTRGDAQERAPGAATEGTERGVSHG
jgi:hypothetical protein